MVKLQEDAQDIVDKEWVSHVKTDQLIDIICSFFHNRVIHKKRGPAVSNRAVIRLFLAIRKASCGQKMARRARKTEKGGRHGISTEAEKGRQKSEAG